MGEHDLPRLRLEDELQQLLTVRVPAELEALHVGTDLGLHIGGREQEIIAGLRREQLATRGVRIAEAHEADGVARLP